MNTTTMTGEEIRQGVIKTIIRALGIIESRQGLVVPTAKLTGDLGADTLDRMDLAAFLQEDFGVRVLPEQAEAFQTVQEVIDFVTERARLLEQQAA